LVVVEEEAVVVAEGIAEIVVEEVVAVETAED
jgi:hypothetical protein